MEELIGVLKKIFVYHKIEFKKEIKAQWVGDLKSFTPVEIEAAWESWRKNPFNSNRHPVPFEIVKIIKASKNFFEEAKIKDDPPLRHGESPMQNTLIRNLDLMKKNMPDLMERLRETGSPKEKILLCAVALEQPGLIQGAFVQNLIKKLRMPENAI